MIIFGSVITGYLLIGWRQVMVDMSVIHVRSELLCICQSSFPSDLFLCLCLSDNVSHHLHLPLRNVRIFPVRSWSSLGYFMLLFGQDAAFLRRYLAVLFDCVVVMLCGRGLRLMPLLLDLPVWRCLANSAGPQVSRKVYTGRVDCSVCVQGAVACMEPVSVFRYTLQSPCSDWMKWKWE